MAIIQECCNVYVPFSPVCQDLDQVNTSSLSRDEQRQCEKLENCAYVHEFEQNKILGPDNHYRTVYFKLLNLYVRTWNNEFRLTTIGLCIENVTDDTDLHVRSNPDEYIQKEGTDQSAICHTSRPKSTAGSGKEKLLSWTGRRTPIKKMKVSKFPKWLLFLYTCFALVPTINANTDFVKTFQNLPETCTQLKECPAYTDSGWQDLNIFCCGAFKDWMLHCHIVQINGTTIHLLACLKSLLIPAGKTAGLVLTETGDIELKVNECNADHYDSNEKMSHIIHEPGCPNSRIKRSKENGKQLKCKGGPTKDDQCFCHADYSPYPYNEVCREGFSSNNGYNCQCVLDPCPDGSGRNISQADLGLLCGDIPHSLSLFDYACQPLLPDSIENKSVHHDVSINDSSRQALDFGTGHDSDLWWLPLLAFAIFLILTVNSFVQWLKREKQEN